MWFELVNRNGQPLGPADKLQGLAADVTNFRCTLKDSRSDSADLDSVEASLLKVYKDRKTYKKRISLAANDPIARFGKQMETALIVEVPKVWFQLMDGGHLKDPVCVTLSKLRVEELCDAAKSKCGDSFPETIKASDLKVYQNWEEYDKQAGGVQLLTNSSIENFGKSRETALIVKLPKVWFRLMDGGSLKDSVCIPVPNLRVEDLREAAKAKCGDSFPDTIKASDLKVYQNWEEYDKRAEGLQLLTNSSIENFGKSRETALIVELPKVWFLPMDGGTRRPLEDAVCVPLANLRVEKLREVVKAKYSDLFPENVKASYLKVYQNLVEYNKQTGGIPLLADSSIENFGKTGESALIVELPKVWFQLMDGGHLKDPVCVILSSLRVGDLRNAAKANYSDYLPKPIQAYDLKVYHNLEEYRKAAGGTPLSENSSIEKFGKSRETPLVVEVPKVWFQLMEGGTRRALKDPVCIILRNLRVEDLRDAAKVKYRDLLPKTFKASDLKVYQNLEEYRKLAGGTPLLAGSSIAKFGKTREITLVVEIPMVWFQLMDGGTRRAITGAAHIPFSESGRVLDLCVAAKAMYKDSILKDVKASELKVYKNMQVYEDQDEGELLNEDSIVNELGKTSRSALILEGPAHLSLLRKRPGADIRQLLRKRPGADIRQPEYTKTTEAEGNFPGL